MENQYQSLLIRYLRGIPNRSSMPSHLFMKRAQQCNSYYCGGLQYNCIKRWYSVKLDNKIPNLIIIRRSDGWELTFHSDSLEEIYYSYMRRDNYLMYIINVAYKEPQKSEYFYDVNSLPTYEQLWGG